MEFNRKIKIEKINFYRFLIYPLNASAIQKLKTCVQIVEIRSMFTLGILKEVRVYIHG